MIVSDNGTELTLNAILKWCAEPSKPNSGSVSIIRFTNLSAGQSRATVSLRRMDCSSIVLGSIRTRWPSTMA